jgi:hypothetical protein
MNKNTVAAAGVIGVLVAVVVWRVSSPSKDVPAPAPPVASSIPSPPVQEPAAAASPTVVASAPAIPVGAALGEVKKLDDARTALRAGDPKRALATLESYDQNEGVLRHEATLIRVEAFAASGRRTDALALAMRTRDDPTFAPYRDRLEEILADAGLTP